MATTKTKKLGLGDYVNWAEPKQKGLHDSCVQCGRKVSKKSFMVHVSIAGEILPIGLVDVVNSQGFWHVGSECAKTFDQRVLTN